MSGLTYFTFIFFFFNDTATTEIYTLSLHDALPIYHGRASGERARQGLLRAAVDLRAGERSSPCRSEEHTSELQSRQYLVCRLLLEKKKIYTSTQRHSRCRSRAKKRERRKITRRRGT